MKAISTFFGPYLAWVKIALLVFVAFKLWPVLSGIITAFTKPLVNLGVQVQQQYEDSSDLSTVRKVYPKATAEDAAVFREDAQTLALAMGYLPGNFSNVITADTDTCFGVVKRYSKYLMVGSAARVGTDKKPMTRKAELRLPVLYGLYNQITNGRTLLSDLERAFSGEWSSTHYTIWRNVIKP